MATALYRRYRPESFSEMIGQAHVTEPLMTALRTGRIGHAYLFSGPRGCGKTTSARILARCLNCAEGPTDTPCGVCPSCIELSREGGGSLDVVEIDAASHGGVDDARDLRERAVFAPARDRYKIFIIDEAHMVTAGGFNALLKIVEEPPPHVKFIFATTEPEKVIGTIRSRTHHYPFRLIAPGALIDYVQQLCDSEEVKVQPGVLPLVVRAGGGSVRDTLSILDQLIAGSEAGEVTLERATGLLGFTSSELIDEVVLALGAGDPAAAFAATDRVIQTGQDPRRFVEDLLERLRDLIVISATTIQGAAAVFRGVPEDQLQRMFEQSQAFARGQLSRIADTVSGTLDTMTGATAPRLHLELMIARALRDQSSGAESARAASTAHFAAPSPAAQVRETPKSPRVSEAVAASAATPVASEAVQAARGNPAPENTAASSSGPAPSPNAAPASSAPVSSTAQQNNTAPAVDVIATMRSAREFLGASKTGNRPPIVPLGGKPEESAKPLTHEASPEQAVSVTEPSAPTAQQSETPVSPVSFDELREAWPALLEELLESDREAWNAVRVVQPLELQGTALSVGLASRADLDTFKALGAAPLREAIVAALGITVTYVPRRVAQVVDQQPQQPGEPAEEPSPAEMSEAAAASPTVVHMPEPARTPDPEAAPSPAPEPAPAPQPEPEPTPAPEPEPEPEPEPATVTEGRVTPGPPRETQNATTAMPTPAPAQQPTPDPFHTKRYGEAVVREVLGARFIEERPLPEGFER